MLGVLSITFWLCGPAAGQWTVESFIENHAFRQSHAEVQGTSMLQRKSTQAQVQAASSVLHAKKAIAPDEMPEVAWRAFRAIAEEQHERLEQGSKANAQPKDPLQSGSVFEAVDISLPLEPPVLKHDRHVGAGQGDKNIVGLMSLAKGRQCVVYGMGIADDSGFEETMQNLGCETHAFDCTVDPASTVVNGKPFKFHHWCIGEKKNNALNPDLAKSTYVHSNVSELQFKSLKETMQELGHSYIDLLKFDIEGFEWKLFESEILTSKNPPEQLSFELHTDKANPTYVPHGNVAGKGYVEVNGLFKSLFDMGYRVTSKEINSGDPACAEFVAVRVKQEM